jgi:hypothetical protein
MLKVAARRSARAQITSTPKPLRVVVDLQPGSPKHQ